MDANKALLSEAEIAALKGQGGAAATAGRSSRHVVKHDLTGEDTALWFNDSVIEMVNERFARQLRSGLVDVLRTNPKVHIDTPKAQKYQVYLKDLVAPLSVNTVRINPWRGYSLVVIEPSIIFAALDNFFGGSGSAVADLPPGRLFTPTEMSIIRILLTLIFASLREAWLPVLTLEISSIASEVNPQFAQIADDQELVLVNRYNLSLGDQSRGSIHVVTPYNSLKPVRDVLRSRVQAREENDDKDRSWRRDLREACLDASLEVVVKLARIPLTLQQLRDLKNGDILAMPRLDGAWAEVNGFQLFNAEVGTQGSNAAIKIQSVIQPEKSGKGA